MSQSNHKSSPSLAALKALFLMFFLSFAGAQFSYADELDINALNVEAIKTRISGVQDRDSWIPSDKFKSNQVMEPLLIEGKDIYELMSNSASMDVSVIFVAGGLSEDAVNEFKEKSLKFPNKNIVLVFALDKIDNFKEISKEYLKSWLQVEELTSLELTFFEQKNKK